MPLGSRSKVGAMTSTQSTIISELHVRPTIDVAAEVSRRVDFLADYLRGSKARGFVLGISGGQDSTLAGKLALMFGPQTY